jgi:hypothetical protein
VPRLHFGEEHRLNCGGSVHRRGWAVALASGKTTVEECYALDIADWLREGSLTPGMCRFGLWGWREAGTASADSRYSDRRPPSIVEHRSGRNRRSIICGFNPTPANRQEPARSKRYPNIPGPRRCQQACLRHTVHSRCALLGPIREGLDPPAYRPPHPWSRWPGSRTGSSAGLPLLPAEDSFRRRTQKTPAVYSGAFLSIAYMSFVIGCVQLH